MIIQVEPNKGAGKIDFGLSRDEVRKLLNFQPKVLPSIARADVPTDLK
jgi:hypothetical protein